MPTPPTNRQVYEEIARCLEGSERGELVNMLTHLIKTYVTEQTMPFTLPGADDEYARQAQAPPREGESGADKPTFAKVIEQIKRRVDLPELRYFSVENGKVTIRVDNQKVTFGEKVTIEFVPVTAPPHGATTGLKASQAGAAAPKEAARPSKDPARPPKDATRAPAQATPASERPEEGPPLSPEEQEALHDIMQRFKRLDLD